MRDPREWACHQQCRRRRRQEASNCSVPCEQLSKGNIVREREREEGEGERGGRVRVFTFERTEYTKIREAKRHGWSSSAEEERAESWDLGERVGWGREETGGGEATRFIQEIMCCTRCTSTSYAPPLGKFVYFDVLFLFCYFVIVE